MLYHTSPTPIKSVHQAGRFGSHLFFSSSPYSMSAGSVVTYAIEIDKNELIDADRLFYHEDAELLDSVVEQVKDMLDCNDEDAERMLEQKEDCGDAEMSWEIQALSAHAAGILGFRGVAMQDEQGECYLIEMANHEAELME